MSKVSIDDLALAIMAAAEPERASDPRVIAAAMLRQFVINYRRPK